MLLLKLPSVRFPQIKSSVAKIRFVGRVEFLHCGSRNPSEGEAAMAEWLRRWTWNPMGFPRAGSNPARSGRIFFELFYVTRNIALEFAGIRNGTKGKQGLGARKSKILHHSKYPFQFQSPITFYSSNVIPYHVTGFCKRRPLFFPLIYDTIYTCVKPLHAHFPPTLTWHTIYY